MRSTVGIPLLPAQAVAEGQGGGGCQPTNTAIGAVLEAENRDMYEEGKAVSADNLGDKAKVASLLIAAFGLHEGGPSVANSKVFAVQAASDFDVTQQFGVYVWTDTSYNPAYVDTTELQILGIFTGSFNADAILIA